MRRHQLRSKVQHYLAPCLFHILHVFWMLLIELSDKSPSDKASIQSSKVRPFSKLKLLDPSQAIQGGDSIQGTSNHCTPLLGTST